MGGYDAGHCGSLCSKVYTLECVDAFRREGMTDRATGMRFRPTILEQGTMEDGGVLLEEFLGRKPGDQALFTHLGINGPEAANREDGCVLVSRTVFRPRDAWGGRPSSRRHHLQTRPWTHPRNGTRPPCRQGARPPAFWKPGSPEEPGGETVQK